MYDEEILKAIPPRPPTARLVWTAIIDVADRQELGISPLGSRFIVPILGGKFYEGPAGPGLNGIVQPGGADRQLLRPDGTKELDAVYEMQVENGNVLMIRNRVVVDESRQPSRYAMSVISISAPNGDLEWLNRRVILGTLQTARPDRQAVVVRAWIVDDL